MKTRLCIIRHGETDWNLAKRIQGQTDIPLNETGRAQAMAMAFDVAFHQAPIKAIYSSDLSRAHETAQVLAQRCELEVQRRQGLRERHYGLFQGVVKDEAEKQFPDAFRYYASRDIHYDFENGESLVEFNDRVLTEFQWIVRHHEGEAVIAVCHAGLLDIMYRTAKQMSLDKERDFAIPNCALNWFHHDGNRWHLDAWDDHHYLKHVIMDSVE